MGERVAQEIEFDLLAEGKIFDDLQPLEFHFLSFLIVQLEHHGVCLAELRIALN